MKQLTINPSNKPYYSEDFIKGFECGTERQFEADKAEISQWIPCSERLPENSTRVLVQVDDMYHTTDTNNGILTGWRKGDYWYTFTIRGCETIRYPLAWMPLPEPWKGADDEADNN